MADDPQNPTPAAAAAAVPTLTPAPTPAAAAPAAAARPKAPMGGGKNGNVPPGAFMERVRRDAVKLVKDQLGLTVEEARAIVEKGGKVIVAGSQEQAAQATANQSIEKLQAENKRLSSQNRALTQRANTADDKLKREQRRRKDAEVVAEIRSAAVGAGMFDPDYAISLFAREAAAGRATDPATYFGSLKTSHAHLFTAGTTTAAAAAAAAAPAAAAPVPTPKVAASTAPPESGAAGQPKPTPAAAGSAVNADNMSPQDFAAHTRGRYGFSPGA